MIPEDALKGIQEIIPCSYHTDVKLQLQETGNWIYEKLWASQIKESKEEKKSKEKTCADHSLLFSSRECRGRNMCTLTFSCLVFSRLYYQQEEPRGLQCHSTKKFTFVFRTWKSYRASPLTKGCLQKLCKKLHWSV